MPEKQPPIFAKLPPGTVSERPWLTAGKAYPVSIYNDTFLWFNADDGMRHRLQWRGGIAARGATWLYAPTDPLGLPGEFRPGPPPL